MKPLIIQELSERLQKIKDCLPVLLVRSGNPAEKTPEMHSPNSP